MFSDQNSDLMGIIIELNKLLPQVQSFITDWHSTIAHYGINVITDVNGDLSIDVPSKLKDVDVNTCTKKIKILDSLIHDRFNSIEKTLDKGYTFEMDLKKSNNNYISVLTEKSKILNELKNSYKH